MGTLTEYLDWRGDIKFSALELCEVDSLILSTISYLNFDGIVPSSAEGGSITYLEAMRAYLKLYGGKAQTVGRLIPVEVLGIAVRAAKTRRYSGIRLSDYVQETDGDMEKQFSAVTFRITRDKYFVCFRGTDDTLIGWKENFNMSFMRPIPAQTAAAEYFEDVADRISGGLFYLGGHSKGGNLAVYSAVKCSEKTKQQILQVFSNDGPGFDKEFITGEDYLSVRPKIRTIVPQSSVVGMLLEHEEDYEVVKSNATGIMQHHGHTWEVMGGSFIHLDTVTESSKLIDVKLKAWLEAMSVEEREALAYVQNLQGNAIITTQEAKMIKAAISDSALSDVPPTGRSIVRANILKHILLSLM